MSAAGIDETLQALLSCICSALGTDGAPVCTCSTTIGSPLAIECCECDEEGTAGALWGDFRRLRRGDRNTYQPTATQRPCAPASWVAEYRITLYRCFPTISERGELPEDEALAAAAMDLNADAATIARAVHCCALDEPASLDTVEVVLDPAGGCSQLVATVLAKVDLRASSNLRWGNLSGDEGTPDGTDYPAGPEDLEG